MISDPKTSEWNLLKVEFDALVHNKGLHEDGLDYFLDNKIRWRFARFMVWAAEHKTKDDHGIWPSDLRRLNQ